MSQAEQQVESFDDFSVMTPEQMVTKEPLGSENDNNDDPSLDTFDNPVATPETVEIPGKEEEKPAKEDTMKKGEKELLEEQEEGKEVKEEKSEDDKEETKEPETQETEEKPQGKKLTGKLGDEKFELDTEMEIGVKVDGRRESVKIQELINNYSGKVAYDKKFTEIDEIRKDAESKLGQADKTIEQFEQEKQKISQDLIDIVSALDNSEGDPMQGVYKLLALANRNPLEFEQRVFAQLQEQFEAFGEMSEPEQKLYWREKELEYYKRQTESSRTNLRTTEDRQRQLQQIDQMRQAQGVSTEEFTKAHNELLEYYKSENMDLNGITPEEVVNHAKMAPFYDQAEGIVDQYETIIPEENFENVYEAAATGLADGLTPEEVTAIIEEEYGDPDEKAVEEKLNALPKKQASGSRYKSNPKEVPESFDDFRDYETGLWE